MLVRYLDIESYVSGASASYGNPSPLVIHSMVLWSFSFCYGNPSLLVIHSMVVWSFSFCYGNPSPLVIHFMVVWNFCYGNPSPLVIHSMVMWSFCYGNPSPLVIHFMVLGSVLHRHLHCVFKTFCAEVIIKHSVSQAVHQSGYLWPINQTVSQSHNQTDRKSDSQQSLISQSSHKHSSVRQFISQLRLNIVFIFSSALPSWKTVESPIAAYSVVTVDHQRVFYCWTANMSRLIFNLCTHLFQEYESYMLYNYCLALYMYW